MVAKEVVEKSNGQKKALAITKNINEQNRSKMQPLNIPMPDAHHQHQARRAGWHSQGAYSTIKAIYNLGGVSSGARVYIGRSSLAFTRLMGLAGSDGLLRDA